MRVIKEGKKIIPLAPIRFICERCECEYEADSEEYRIDTIRGLAYSVCPTRLCRKNNRVEVS